MRMGFALVALIAAGCTPVGGGSGSDCREADNACAGDFICAAVALEQYECRPPCNNGACPVGERCDDFSGACIPGEEGTGDGGPGADVGPDLDAIMPGDGGVDPDDGVAADRGAESDASIDPDRGTEPDRGAVDPPDAGPRVSPYGAPCESGEDCMSGICADLDGADRCSDFCESDDDCPPWGEDIGRSAVCDRNGICAAAGEDPLWFPCESDAGCRSRRCHPDGYCTASCFDGCPAPPDGAEAICELGECRLVEGGDVEFDDGDWSLAVILPSDNPRVMVFQVPFSEGRPDRIRAVQQWCGDRPCGPDDRGLYAPLDSTTNDIDFDANGLFVFSLFGGLPLPPPADLITGVGGDVFELLLQSDDFQSDRVCGIASVRIRFQALGVVEHMDTPFLLERRGGWPPDFIDANRVFDCFR